MSGFFDNIFRSISTSRAEKSSLKTPESEKKKRKKRDVKIASTNSLVSFSMK